MNDALPMQARSRAAPPPELARLRAGPVLGLMVGGVVTVTVVAGALMVTHTVLSTPHPQTTNYRSQSELATSNTVVKTDRLPEPAPAFPTLALRTAIQEQTMSPPASEGALAFASTASPVGVAAEPVVRLPGPVASRNRKQSTVILDDAQIRALKQRLQLTAKQEKMWPPVEAALRSVVAQMHEASRKARGAPVPIDVTTPEIEQLRKVAIPFIAQLRPEQKDTVHDLAGIVGLDRIVAGL